MKKLFLILSLLIGSCGWALAADDAPNTYYVPPSGLNAQLQVMKLGFANSFALFQNSTSSFSFNDSSKTISRLRIAIDSTSLIAGNPASQRDLASLIDSGRYSEMDITAPDSVSFTDGKATLKGTLTFHGVSKPVTLDAVLNHVGKSPQAGGLWSHEGDAVGLSLRTSFKRADFGAGDDSGSDTPVRFGDSMTLLLEMQAIQQ